MGNPLPWLLVVVRYAVKPVEAKYTRGCVESWLGCEAYLATAHEHFNSKSASGQAASKRARTKVPSNLDRLVVSAAHIADIAAVVSQFRCFSVPMALPVWKLQQ